MDNNTNLPEVRKDDIVEMVNHQGLGNMFKPFINEIHLFDTYISGTSYTDEAVIGSLSVGDKLTLRREESKFDENGITILTKSGDKVGYIPEKDNVIFARLLDAGKLLEAKVADINKGKAFTRINIGIYLVDF